MKKAKFDFSGWATKYNIKCTDGRTIKNDAFKHMDGQTVPLVYMHQHSDLDAILGNVLLEHRSGEGLYAYGSLNNTQEALRAKELLKHGDIKRFSIAANSLKQDDKRNVLHGVVREVSLVLSGANPGAVIDNLAFSHSDGTIDIDEEEAVIHSGLDFTIEVEETINHSDDGKGKNVEKTVKEVFDSLSEEQKNVVYFLIGQAAEGDGDDVEQSDLGGNGMKKNLFDGSALEVNNDIALVHSALRNASKSAFQNKGSLKDYFIGEAERMGLIHSDGDDLEHAGTYGIDNIDFLFPDARTINPTPDFISRDMGWVEKVVGAAHHSPFSRIKSIHANITEDEARAKGYIKGGLKKEEVFGLLKRTTTPQTVYKKQKLDRDDVIDIVDFDVVLWMKGEMKLMLREELGRAILIGDGRDVASEDKINETNIRPIYTDADLYTIKYAVPFETTDKDLIDHIVMSQDEYKGSGNVTLFTTKKLVTRWMLAKDSLGRRLYPTKAELAAAMAVDSIVEVPVMQDVKRTVGDKEKSLIGIILNMKDYNIGADKGGEVNMFDDFDIDYNQMKYLLETRVSGALTVPYSAIVIERDPEVVGG